MQMSKEVRRKRVTVSVDEQTVDKSLRVAQAMHKSVRQMIREYLEHVAYPERAECNIAEFRRLSALGRPDVDWKYSREDAYDRKICRGSE